MTPTSGAISLDNIRTELGLTGAISLGDTLVRKCLFKTSGAINLSDGYAVQYNLLNGSTNGFTITNNSVGGKFTVEVASGANLGKWGSSAQDEATIYVTLSVPGAQFRLINNGTIYGAGGVGGYGGRSEPYYAARGADGLNGGSSLRVIGAVPVTIENNGTMMAGSGGGGGGGGGTYTNYACTGGGGGGGGSYGIYGGSGGPAFNGTYNVYGSSGGGGSQTTSAGYGGSPGQYYSVARGGNGGNGGSTQAMNGYAGYNGAIGSHKGAGGAGGPAGKVVTGSGATFTWTATGTRYGTIGP